jgi:spore coat polysaccharide biosynthesis protein SpsF
MKIGFFITARLKSSRLKQKILLDLNGKTVLDRVIDRAKKVIGIDGVVLCTSTHPQDSVLYKYAVQNNIQFYAGSEQDVLNRLLNAAEYYGYDAFVGITADNPLFSIYTSNIMVDMYKKERFDFVNTKGLPMGCNTYIIDVMALQVVDNMKQEADTEIWGPFINRPDFFNVAELVVENSPINSDIRITLDYVEDYKFIKSIYSKLEKKEIPTIFDVLELLNESPGLMDINKIHKQSMLTKEQLDEIDAQFNSMKENAVQYAKKIGKKLIPNHSKYKFILSI